MKNSFSYVALAIIFSVAFCACQSGTASAPEACEGACPNTLLKIAEDIPTIQSFLMDPVPEADIERIVNAGVNAPSGMNMQPWHFTVVSNPETIKQLAEAQKESMKNMKFPPMPKDMPKMGDGPKPGEGPKPGDAPNMGEGPKPGEGPKFPGGRGPKSGLGDSPLLIIVSSTERGEFDAGLACESMNTMANLLGYGTKIASSVKILFDGENKENYYAQFQIPEGQHIVTAILVGKVNTENYDAVTTATPRKPQTEVVTYLK